MDCAASYGRRRQVTVRKAAELVTRVATALVVGGLLATAQQPARAAEGDQPGTLTVDTVPATPGARVAVGGRVAVADRHGRAQLPVSHFTGLDRRLQVPPTRVAPDRRVSYDRIMGNPGRGFNGRPVVIGLSTERLVRWTFVTRGGSEVDTGRVTALTLVSNTGERRVLKGRDLTRPVWVSSSRTQQTRQGLTVKEISWRVDDVVVDGADVVNRGQQVYFPERNRDWRITLLFYRVQFLGRDLLFGRHAGQGIELVLPGGRVIRQAFDEDGVAAVDGLPRGEYDARVYGGGLSFVRPLSVSKDEHYELEVISRLAIGLVVSTIAIVAVLLVAVGRRRRLRGLFGSFRSRLARVLGVGIAVAAVGSGVVLLDEGSPAEAAQVAPGPGAEAVGRELPPVFAYYYIWYQPTSWQRAKKDYPLLGRYSSDDPVVLERHVAMAQAAGLDGFLVSWKGEGHLSNRLSQLVRIADRTGFKLGIVYQGLDFDRNPLPVSRVAADLQSFADTYADDNAFDAFGQPVVVITGTERYTLAELRRATAGVRDRLRILASAKSVEEYRRTASVMEGDAYYWSSADPRSAWHRDRLKAIGAAVHDDGGFWLAPAAAGFDARMIGGRQVIRREGGETLRVAMSSAASSDPDAIGVISWNEFSENSHVEPSEKYGAQELRALADLLGGQAVLPPGVTPASEAPRDAGLPAWAVPLVMGLILAVLTIGRVAHRRRGRASPVEVP